MDTLIHSPELTLQNPQQREQINSFLRTTDAWLPELGVGTGLLLQPKDDRDYRFSAIINGELHLATDPTPAPTNVNGVVSISRDMIPSVQDQYYQGACVGGAGANAIGTVARLDPRTSWETDYSWQWLYNGARRAIGELHLDQGSYIRDMAKFAANHGVARESDFPYYRYQDTFNIDPLSQPNWVKSAEDFKLGGYYECKTLEEVKAAIKLGFPVVLGFLCFSNLWEANATGRIPLPSGSLRGGHAVMGAEDDEANRFISGPNTWGRDWAANQTDAGWYHLPYAFWEQGYVSDVWAFTAEAAETYQFTRN